MQLIELEQTKHIVMYRYDGTRFEMTQVQGMNPHFQLTYPKLHGGWRTIEKDLPYGIDFETQVNVERTLGFKEKEEVRK